MCCVPATFLQLHPVLFVSYLVFVLNVMVCCIGHSQDFIQKAYADSPPMDPSNDLASAVAAQLRFTPVRSTSALLSETSVGKKKAQAGALAEGLLQNLGPLVQMARQLDNVSQLLPNAGQRSHVPWNGATWGRPPLASLSSESLGAPPSQSATPPLPLPSGQQQVPPLQPQEGGK